MDSIASALKPMYRMPVSFGPSAGPRNVPSDASYEAGALRTASISVSALSDADALTALLPDGCELDGEPVLTAGITRMYDIGWLAGRSYNIVRVTLPVRFRDQGELLRGSFMPVLWESLADPIVTGRDELGHPKLWAEIPDPVVSAGGEDVSGGSSWLGFPFFEIEATGLQDAPPPAAGGPGHVLTAKYVPRTGAWGEPDVDYLTYGTVRPPDEIVERRQGEGRFAFHPARWEDMPTQYTVVSALAALPLYEFRAASWVMTATVGEPIGLNHKIVS